MSTPAAKSIYDKASIIELFNDMDQTYERVSDVTSFGFNRRWRRWATRQFHFDREVRICDMMAGGGELWPYLTLRMPSKSEIVAVDFCPRMTDRAKLRAETISNHKVTVLVEDAISSSVAQESMDGAICSYGIKTLSEEEYEQLGVELNRILKPGAMFVFTEISVPQWVPLRALYMFYLRTVIPIFGKLLLGNPDTYRMLGVYTSAFQNISRFYWVLKKHGFDVQLHTLFWGCATAVVGRKPFRE